MWVLSIKVLLRKKTANLFNDPCKSTTRFLAQNSALDVYLLYRSTCKHTIDKCLLSVDLLLKNVVNLPDYNNISLLQFYYFKSTPLLICCICYLNLSLRWKCLWPWARGKYSKIKISECLCDVMANVFVCDLIIKEFKCLLYFYVLFQTNKLEESINTIVSPSATGSIVSIFFNIKDFWH